MLTIITHIIAAGDITGIILTTTTCMCITTTQDHKNTEEMRTSIVKGQEAAGWLTVVMPEHDPT